MSVFVAAILGFVIGCILHVVPSTAPFVYTDVLALGIASLAATLLTTIWVWIDPDFEPLLAPSGSPETGARGLTSQDRIGVENNGILLERRSPSEAACGTQVKSSDGSPLALKFTELLAFGATKQSPNPSEPLWSYRVLQIASKMWRDGSLVITLSNRQLFMEHGFENSWSFSEYHNGNLSVIAGFLDKSEIKVYKDRFYEKLAYL
jgi:hypothetical protein